jgi:hypothetical protein
MNSLTEILNVMECNKCAIHIGIQPIQQPQGQLTTFMIQLN